MLSFSSPCWLAQNTLQLCPEERLLVDLMGPLQVRLGTKHLLELAVLARQGVGINGLLHHKYDIIKGLTHCSLLSEVQFIVAPLTVDKVPGEDEYHLKMDTKKNSEIMY